MTLYNTLPFLTLFWASCVLGIAFGMDNRLNSDTKNPWNLLIALFWPVWFVPFLMYKAIVTCPASPPAPSEKP